jgi:lipopolysaccharide/colanic/teichoic acid biosynthesis glycosyltransferase
MPGWKRALDVACCLAVLPILALCTLAMALVMKIVSPGPVFFRQERVGYLGRRFKIYKFRTM